MSFHDDLLLKVTFDPAAYQLVLTIETLDWIPASDGAATATNVIVAESGNAFVSVPGKTIDLVLQLKGKLMLNFEHVTPSEILWVEFDGEHFSLTTVLGDIACSVKSYLIVEGGDNHE